MSIGIDKVESCNNCDEMSWDNCTSLIMLVLHWYFSNAISKSTHLVKPKCLKMVKNDTTDIVTFLEVSLPFALLALTKTEKKVMPKLKI